MQWPVVGRRGVSKYLGRGIYMMWKAFRTIRVDDAGREIYRRGGG